MIGFAHIFKQMRTYQKSISSLWRKEQVTKWRGRTERSFSNEAERVLKYKQLRIFPHYGVQFFLVTKMHFILSFVLTGKTVAFLFSEKFVENPFQFNVFYEIWHSDETKVQNMYYVKFYNRVLQDFFVLCVAGTVLPLTEEFLYFYQTLIVKHFNLQCLSVTCYNKRCKIHNKIVCFPINTVVFTVPTRVQLKPFVWMIWYKTHV